MKFLVSIFTQLPWSLAPNLPSFSNERFDVFHLIHSAMRTERWDDFDLNDVPVGATADPPWKSESPLQECTAILQHVLVQYRKHVEICGGQRGSTTDQPCFARPEREKFESSGSELRKEHLCVEIQEVKTWPVICDMGEPSNDSASGLRVQGVAIDFLLGRIHGNPRMNYRAPFSLYSASNMSSASLKILGYRRRTTGSQTLNFYGCCFIKTLSSSFFLAVTISYSFLLVILSLRCF